MKKSVEILEKVLNTYIQREVNFVALLNDKEKNILSIQKFLKGSSLGVGSHYIMLNKKLHLAKHYLSACAMVHDFCSTVHVPKDEYWIGIDELSLLFLSDNLELYKELNKHKRYHNLGEEKGGWQGMQKALFEIASSDWDGLKQTINYLKSVKEPFDPLFHNIEFYFEIYDSFLNGNKEKLEKNLNELEQEKWRNVRQKQITIEKNISILTLALAKLAWMHGMEVEINSEYVPKELLPFEPLEEYTIPYAFLRDFYREQEIDWRYDPHYPELQDWQNDPENPKKPGGFFNRFFN